MRAKIYYSIMKEGRILLFLCLLLCAASAFSQTATGRKISGNVTDESGLALPGVSVSVKGSRTGTSTGNDGSYSINATKGTTLLFRFIGFEEQQVAVGESAVLNVRLKPSSSSLNEVVVVSYGTQTNRSVTGSIATIKAATMEDYPVAQFTQQLQGKLAGVQINAANGQPGRGMEVRIRGAASLTAGNSPLYVIDGIPITGSINNINPAEIETFTVLKDASASALYGSRAANGVVLITTRHAKPGESKIQLSANYGVQAVPQRGRPDMMNAREFAEFQNEFYQDRVKYENYTGALNPVYANPERYGEGTNWFDYMIREAAIQDYNVTISTAKENSSSTIIAGYFNQEGVMKNTDVKRFSLRMNQDFSLSSKVKVGFGLAPSYRIDHNARINSEGVGQLLSAAVKSSPLISPVDANGEMPYSSSSPGMIANTNPYKILMLTKDDYKTTRLLGNAYFNYEFLTGLTLKTSIALDLGSESRNRFIPKSISGAAAPGQTISTTEATATYSSVNNYSWTADANLNYAKTFARDHNVEILAGYSVQKFESGSGSVNGTNFPNDEIPYLNQATLIPSGSSSAYAYSLLSVLGRVNYNYKGRYLLEAAMRQDGSSRFGKASKYGFFPSVSVGWVLSDEAFMKSIPVINLLKLRASYGVTGNNDIGNYKFISGIGNYNYVFNNTLVSGQTISSLENSELAWERNKSFDIGLDLSVLNNRISFTYDYYHKLTDGLLYDTPIPRASGFTAIAYNVGTFKMWGHEFTINTVNLTGKLKWNSNFNISFDKNQVVKLVSPGYIDRSASVNSGYYRNQEGQPLGMFYGYINDGIYLTQHDLDNQPVQPTSRIGTVRYKDVKADGVIDVGDRTFIGNPNPDFIFGFTNTFEYKNFDLAISMSGSVGNDIFNATHQYTENLDGAFNITKAAKNRWRSPENPGNGYFTSTYTGTTGPWRAAQSLFIEDGSHLTVKNITLGYNCPVRGLLMRNIRLYASIQQAFVLTNYSGLNPEVSLEGEASSGKGIGIDEWAYPIPRTFSFGLTATFK